MKSIYEKYLKSPEETMLFEDFEVLASAGESNLIERKSIRLFDEAKKNKDAILGVLAKEISAFSNYEGGVILIGVTDDGVIEQGATNNVIGRQTTKEWLENITWTCVTPPLRDFAVKITVNNGEYYYSIFVGKSSVAPHQAAMGDGIHRYFTRVSSKSQPIDGIIVRDIFTRKTYPEIEPRFNLIRPKITGEFMNDPDANLSIRVYNNSHIAGEYVIIRMVLSDPIIIGGYSENGNEFRDDRIRLYSELVYPETDQIINDDIPIKKFNKILVNTEIIAKNMVTRRYSHLLRVKNFEEYSIETTQRSNDSSQSI